MVLLPSGDRRLMPKQIYMENRSFRDILHKFLEEDAELTSEDSSRETYFSAEFAPFFDWKAPEFRAKPRHGYATPPSRKVSPPTEEKPARPVESERILSLNELKGADQLHARAFIHLGAEELAKGISLSRVKKAHRRLAKRLHPDAGGKRELFQLLQSAYEALSRSLPSYINASACENGSASAGASQRRDAA